MSDDEVESFEITDYDLQSALSTNRRGKWLTKDQQIYGVWAQGGDNENQEEAPPPPSLKPRVMRGGLSFISAGVQGGKQKGEEKTERSILEEQQEEGDGGEQMPRPMFKGIIDSSDEEEELNPMPVSFGGKKTLGTSFAQRGGSASRNLDNEIAGLRHHRRGKTQGGRDANLADWERHTTGIGSKLLKKMGFEEGKGLGKNLQGISTPVEATLRKGKGAIGFYGAETRSERSLKDFPVQVDSEEEETEQFKAKLHQWRKTGNKKGIKTKYVYKSVEEVLAEGKCKKLRPEGEFGGNHVTAHTKVIDMTGPETRVLSGYQALGGQRKIADEYEEVRRRKYEHFDLPELLHNLEILIEKCEDDLVRNARTKNREGDRIVHLEHERERSEGVAEREQKELAMLDEAMRLINRLESGHQDRSLSLMKAGGIFGQLKGDYSKIYSTYEIPFLAPTYVIPLLKEVLAMWNPLVNHTTHREMFATWQDLVEVDPTSTQPTGDKPMDPYHHLVWETWAAAVRSAAMGPWDPHDPEPLIRLLDAWGGPPLVPEWIQSHLLQHVILPRITRAVKMWNPVEDTVPIHAWIHPWLPILSDYLQCVYPVIRQKLTAALVHWHPSDRSAKMVLHPWRGVFSEVALVTLIQNSIQPKLELALLEMPISPHAQSLESWHWFLDWDDFLPPTLTLSMLEKCFWPRWFQALAAWLAALPGFTEVLAWFKGWRDMMPQSVAGQQQVTQKLHNALEVCCRTLSYQPGATEQFNLLLSGLDKLIAPPPPPPPGSPPHRPPPKNWADIITASKREPESLSMRMVVEKRCVEQGILFHPLPEKSHQGRPVYKCGKLNVSFHKNILWVQTERTWLPKSLTTLLDDA